MAVQPQHVHSELARCVPADVVDIVVRLENRGFDTWVVGGAVRDAVYGSPQDWDLTTRAVPKEIRKAFGRTVPLGVDHGTLGVIGDSGTMYEVTTFRKDVETTGRHAVVRFADRVEDDLSRRDFTFNAMAWHPTRHTLLDPHGGLADLRDGVLRTVGDPAERFAEDYLRILRALRFAGRLKLEVHPDTWTALVKGVPNITFLSGERIREEVLKVLGVDRPARALDLYRRSGALGVIFPELAESFSAPHFEIVLGIVERIRPHHTIARLAALMSVGRGDPVRAGKVTSRMKRLRFSNDEVDAVSRLLRSDALPDREATDAEVRRWLSRHDGERLNDLFRIRIAEARARGAGQDSSSRDVLAMVRRMRAILQAGTPLQVGDLALDGNDFQRMGLKPGPHFKELFRRLLDEVLEDPGLNDATYLERRVRELETSDS